MRIDTIEISNFRQYRNLVFKFPRKDQKKDLHIVLAKNGVGKTNLLNAITWCLYDSEMHLGDKYSASPILNNQVAEEFRTHLQENGTDVAEVSVNITLASDDNLEKVIFKRIGRFSVSKDAIVSIPAGKEPLFTVMQYKNEWQTFTSEEDTLALLKTYLPEEIHDYIFFDGEHLEQYFRAGQSKNIQNGIEELTQAKLLESAEQSFNKYIKEVLNPQLSKSGDSDVATAQEEINKTQSAIDSSSANLDQITSQINQCDDTIADLDNVISGHVNLADKTKRLKEVEQSIEDLNKQIAANTASMLEYTRKSATIMALYPCIKEFYQYIQEQDKRGKLPPRIDKFLLAAIEEHKHCLICDQDLSDHSVGFISALKKELEVSSETSALLNKSVVTLRQYLLDIADYKDKKTKLTDKDKSLRKLKVEYIEEEKQLNTYLMSIPNNEEINDALKKRKDYKLLRDEYIKKKALEEDNIKKLNDQLVEQNKKMKVLVDKNQKLEKIERQLEYCKRCRNILKETRLDILEECRDEMEVQTFEIFKKLLWKKGAFSKVEILADYTFKLLDAYGAQTLGSCSAAERALLALSFTLALQEVSNHDSLLFIDTPIGRVDTDNRNNFIRILCEVAEKKQVILTFTPSEFDDNVQQALGDQYSTFDTLDIEDGITIKS